MNNEMWRTHAMQACYAYKKIYDILPKKVGIHPKRFPYHRGTYLIFPQQTPWSLVDIQDSSPPRTSLYFITIEPIMGSSILFDEVYLPLKGNEQEDRVWPGTTLIRTAQHFERLD